MGPPNEYWDFPVGWGLLLLLNCFPKADGGCEMLKIWSCSMLRFSLGWKGVLRPTWWKAAVLDQCTELASVSKPASKPWIQQEEVVPTLLLGTLLQCEVEFGFAGDINRTAEMWSQSTAALHLVADSGMLCAEPPAAIRGECPCAWHECPEQHAGTGWIVVVFLLYQRILKIWCP